MKTASPVAESSSAQAPNRAFEKCLDCRRPVFRMASFRSWWISAEVERRYSLDAHPGAISFLAYLNQARMGRYQAALSIPRANISNTREYRYKYGFGLNCEQEVAKDVSVFFTPGLE